MQVDYLPADLQAFEADIAALFAAKQIRAPIHLAGGNEQQLISVFEEHVEPEDWICCTWRSHYHCLLKGVPPVEVRQAILDGHSIALCFPEYKVISSAIVGGMAPIAAGIAMAIRRKGATNKVVVFLGDMAASTGIVHEAMKYAIWNELPIMWVIEDNRKSVLTDTRRAWGGITQEPEHPSVVRYSYEPTWPHCGINEWVSF